MFGDLQSARLIHLKGWLFLLIGLLASACLIAEFTDWRHTLLLGAAIWGFCRFYYYAFYVIEKYTDAQFKFAGIGSFLKYFVTRKA